MTSEVKLAGEFLATLESPRESWAGLFATWAEAKGLDERTTRETRVAVLRMRLFGIQRRARARRRPR